MTTTQSGKDLFLSLFEDRERAAETNGRAWLGPVRRAAIGQFEDLGLPGPRDEQWRSTSLAELAATNFGPAPAHALNAEDEARLKERVFEGLTCSRLVFVNGRLNESGCVRGNLPEGVVLESLAESFSTRGDLLREHLTREAGHDEDAFTALNTAFADFGAVIVIPPGVAVEEPIHLRFIAVTEGTPFAVHPRVMILAGEGSRATIIETHIGWGGAPYFTNAMTEAWIGARAEVDHYKIQREAPDAFHIGSMKIHQGEHSNFSSHALTFGAKLGRTNIHAILDGEHCETTLNGLYMTDGKRHAASYTKLEHAKPNCHSRQLYKGVLDGESTAVFNGWILVQPDAQKTDAIQSNRALLLSENATINTQPQLEIYADDVKCTHGATVGEPREDARFYLRSRGIGKKDADDILTYAFANEIIDGIKVEPVRRHLERIIRERFERKPVRA